MKNYFGICSFCLLMVISAQSAHAEKKNDLQTIIDQAAPGEKIHLKGGTYSGPAVISKPIEIIGSDKSVIKSSENSEEEVITLKSSGISIENVEIIQDGYDHPALAATGDNLKINNVAIRTNSIGMNLDNVHNSRFSDISIKGNGEENGIFLLNSTKNEITQSKINNVLDGIYIEDSSTNSFRGNTILESRYGFHLMFSKNLSIEGNESRNNFIGAMIMESENTSFKNNLISDNSQNVNSYGFLMYNTQKSKIVNNQFDHNRIGIKLEQSSEIEVKDNTIQSNFIGIQFQNSFSNHVSLNTFEGNVNDAHAIDSHDNILKENYWDQAWKVDLAPTGKSAIPYKVDPFFLGLAEEVPEYQLFFQSPGMNLLQKMLKSPDSLLLADREPLMAPPASQSAPESGRRVWMISLFMIITSSLLTYILRRNFT
ncbi:right-handed parallel beta-helix repeat-containing protein [Metabacillus sp. SLBN-84]